MSTPTDPATREARLGATADGWLAAGLLAEPANRAEAEEAVRTAYVLAGLAEPTRIDWHGSPRSGVLAARQLDPATAGRSVRAAVRTRPWAAARARLTSQLGAAGWSRHWAASGARNWQLLTDRLVTPIRTRLEAELSRPATSPDSELSGPATSPDSALSRPAAASPDSELGPDDPGARLALLDAVHGQHDGAWLPAFDDAPELAGLARVARSAGWWWPYERVVILTERPTAVHRDNLGRLHHGDGPALSYPDGWGLHAWRGMPIPADVAARLPHLDAAQIQAETNAEVRRVMLEHFGFERYLRDCDAQQVHQDETGVLWRVPMDRDEPLVMVEVINSTPEPDGTRRTYFLRVPPATRTAREGVAWTFGLTAEEYQPLLQT